MRALNRIAALTPPIACTWLVTTFASVASVGTVVVIVTGLGCVVNDSLVHRRAGILVRGAEIELLAVGEVAAEGVGTDDFGVICTVYHVNCPKSGLAGAAVGAAFCAAVDGHCYRFSFLDCWGWGCEGGGG